jgi:transposase-like protein
MAIKRKKFMTQKDQGIPELTEDQARDCIEKIRWSAGLCCIECGSVDDVYKLSGESTRPGLIKCRACKAQFTVTVGTILEDSHIPLSKWIKAFHFMASSKKGMSVLQLQRNLGLGSYKTAWHLAHRIRYAMNNLGGLLKGQIQADETYVGGRHKNVKRGRGTDSKREFCLLNYV